MNRARVIFFSTILGVSTLSGAIAPPHQNQLQQANRLQAEGRYAEASQLYQELLAKAEPGTSRHAEILNNAASVHFQLGNVRAAEALYHKALKIWNQEPDRLEVAITSSNLGTLYRNLGRYEEADQHYQRSLDWFAQHDSESVSALTVWTNVAELRRRQERYEEALEACRFALVIGDKHLRPPDPRLASVHQAFGSVYHSLARYADALEHYRIALDMKEKTLGADHPSLGSSHTNMASLYTGERLFEKAEHHAQRAVDLAPKGSQASAIALNNLAQVFRLQHRYEEAEPLYRQALAALGQSVGTGTPDYALAVANLAEFFEERGRYPGAVKLYTEAYDILEGTLGKGHSQSLKIRNKLAGVYEAMGRNTEASRIRKPSGAIPSAAFPVR
jgi:tetratricopeptide (TPR) repeat protein